MFSGPRHHANVHLRTSPARHRPHVWQTTSWRPAAEGDDDYNNYVEYHDDDNDVVNDDDNDADNDDDNDDEGMILTARLTFWQASSTGLFSPTSPTASRALSMF